MNSKPLAFGTNILVITIVVLYLIIQLAAQVLPGSGWLTENLYLYLVAVQLLVIFLPAVVFLLRHHIEPVSFLHIRGLSFPEALLIILMTAQASFIASVLNAIAVYLLEKVGPVKMESIPTPKSAGELCVQILVIAVLPALCEEFFFRGVIFRSFERYGTWPAIGVSAFYFALFHFDLRNLLGPLFLGVLITWWCYRTGSVFAAVLAHFVNNLMVVLAGWFVRETAELPMMITGDSLKQMLSVACFVGIVLAILLKAFEGITRKKAQKRQGTDKLNLAVLLHWPVCLFYGTYLIIAIIFITSLPVR